MRTQFSKDWRQTITRSALALAILGLALGVAGVVLRLLVDGKLVQFPVLLMVGGTVYLIALAERVNTRQMAERTQSEKAQHKQEVQNDASDQ